jgi:hypothetical protein
MFIRSSTHRDIVREKDKQIAELLSLVQSQSERLLVVAGYRPLMPQQRPADAVAAANSEKSASSSAELADATSSSNPEALCPQPSTSSCPTAAAAPPRLLGPWLKRASSPASARKPHEGDWMMNQAFAAGRSGPSTCPRASRPRRGPAPEGDGRSMQTADVLTQYVWTAIGKLAADDFRPQMLADYGSKELADRWAEPANKAYSWGWDEEWKRRRAAPRPPAHARDVRDRRDPLPLRPHEGRLVGDVPHAPSQGHTYTDPRPARRTRPSREADPAPGGRARLHGEAKYYGEPIDLRRSAKAPSSGSPFPVEPARAAGDRARADFPWEIVVRPVDRRPEGDLRRPSPPA